MKIFKKHPWIFISITICILIPFLIGIQSGKSKATSLWKETKPIKKIMKKTINSIGEVDSYKKVKISAIAAGKLSEINVRNGEQVQKGQHIFSIYSEETQNQINSLQEKTERLKEELINARYQMNMAKEELEEAKEQLRQQTIAPKKYQSIKKRYLYYKNILDVKDKLLAINQKNLVEANEKLERSKYFAPIDGIIIFKGTNMIVGNSYRAGQELATLKSRNILVIRATIDETDARLIHQNQPIKILRPSIVQSDFKVNHISPIVKDKKVGIEVIIRDNNELLIGNTVELEISLQQKESALVIPIDFLNSDENGDYIWTRKNNDYRKNYVQKGIINYDFVEIIPSTKLKLETSVYLPNF